MKRVLILLMLAACIKLSAPPPAQEFVILHEETLNNLEAIWQAVIKVESNGNPDAFSIDINGQPSVGIAQIQPSRIAHYNRLTGHSYSLADCFDPEVSKEVFMFFAKRIGNEEKLIKAWNGSGPRTEIYYNKVRRYL
ncbi:MAG: transglycosylase SLT domain-containing protein [Rikenellaceae bacterium]